MQLLVSAVISLFVGFFITRFSQDKKVKPWFLLTCIFSSALAAGLWVEIKFQEWTIFAAKVNLTMALLLAGAGLISARIICGFKTQRLVLILFSAASILNIATLWFTDLYINNQLYHYPWGYFASGNWKFMINPLLVAIFGAYAIILLIRNYNQAHSLDKNRSKYIMIAYFFLFLSMLDYLYHFGINLFNGPISALCIPLFAGIFGYASLRYRLVEFNSLVGNLSGYFLTFLLMVGGYTLFLETSRHWLYISEANAHIGAALFMIILLFIYGTFFPDWAKRIILGRPIDYQSILREFSEEVMSVLDESVLCDQLNDLSKTYFNSSSTEFIDAGILSFEPLSIQAIRSDFIIDIEVYRRVNGWVPENLSRADIVVPLIRRNDVIGALAIGKRNDGRMYSEKILEVFRTLGNLFTMAICNSRIFKEVEDSKKQIELQMESFLLAMASAIESKDKYTGGHVERVGSYARILAQKIGIQGDDLRNIYLGALVHDIGKIGTRDSVLNKKGPLKPDERRHIEEHTIEGKRILEKIANIDLIREIVYCHQERWDGSGYPRKLKGKEIPLAARIVSIADFWDSVITDRPYRKAMSIKAAIHLMFKERAMAFDPELFDVFMDEKEKLYLLFYSPETKKKEL